MRTNKRPPVAAPVGLPAHRIKDAQGMGSAIRVARSQAKRKRRGDKALVDARNALVLANLALVDILAAAVYRRIGGAVEIGDLRGYAALGLLQAAQRFHPGGATFSTYASPVIRGAIADGLRSVDHLSRSHRNACRAGEEAPPVILSLDAPAGESDSNTPLYALILDSAHGGPPLSVAEQIDSMRHLLAGLSPRTQAIVLACVVEGVRQPEIARRLGLTPGRISQLLIKALTRLRKRGPGWDVEAKREQE